jgi:hypothetical protein
LELGWLGWGVVWVGWGVGGLTRAKPGNCTSVLYEQKKCVFLPYKKGSKDTI